MEQKRFKKTTNTLWSIGNILLIFVGLALFVVATVLIGELINYSPWSLLIIDVIFVFAVYKLSNELCYSEHNHNGANKKMAKLWDFFIVFLILLGVSISIGVSLEHPWALLNIPALIFLFFFCLVLFTTNAIKNGI